MSIVTRRPSSARAAVTSTTPTANEGTGVEAFHGTQAAGVGARRRDRRVTVG